MKRVLSLQNAAPKNLVQVGEKVADRLVPLIVETLTDAGRDRVFVGNNDFGAPGGHTGSVDVTTDALGTRIFTQNRVDSRPTVPLFPNTPGFPPMDLPSVRPAVHRDGTVYAAFLGIRANIPTQLIDVVVVRDDAWAAGANPFQARS